MAPLYDARCPEHGEQKNVWGGMNDDLLCPECGAVMLRLITATRINPDWDPYLEVNMGGDPVYVTSRQHYYRELRKRGLNCKDDTRG